MTQQVADSKERDDLHGLITALRDCAASAETIAASGDTPRIAKEAARLRAMLLAWDGLRDGSDLDARMHFTAGIQFFAEVTTRNGGAAQDRARQLADHIQGMMPGPARRIDVAALAEAIERKARGRWDWKAVVRAWGRADMNPESWRTDWNRWVDARSS